MYNNAGIKGVPLPGLTGLTAEPSPMKTNDPRQFIRNFSFNNCKPGNQGFQRLLIQLFGYAGHGKSSFINTCKVIWENSAYNNHTNMSGSYGGDTVERKTYQLTENILLVDNRGCSTMKSDQKGEIFAQLANLMPLNMKVDWCQGFKLADRIVEAEPLVKSSDFVSPIFIYSVSAGYSPNPDDKEELKEILETCREMTGVEAIVVLTHKMKGNVKRVEDMFKDFGVTNVFSLENYTSENHTRSAEVDNSVITFLYEVAQDAQFRVNEERDAQNEMRDRKIFVLNYIHEKELETHRQKLERQNALEIASIERVKRTREEEEEKQKKKEKAELEARIRKMEEEFERQRLRDQYEHEQKMAGQAKKVSQRKKK